MDNFLNDIWERLRATLDPATIGDGAATLVANLVVAGAVFFAFYLAWRLVEKVMTSALQRAGIDATGARFLLTTAKVVILAVGLIHALDAIGVNTASVLTSLGIAGLTIGFAARDGLSNIISGIFIFWDRPFVIGDLIEVEGNYGRVEDITLRSTRVITSDGKMLSIPNTTMVNSTVASYTNFPHLRLDIEITIGPAEDIGRVRELLLDLVKEREGLLATPPPALLVTALGDYNVTVVLQVWLDDERSHIEQRARLREAIYARLMEAGVNMPNETISLTPVSIRHVEA